MNLKQYTFARLAIAICLAALVSVSVGAGNYIIPIFAVAAALVLILVLRKNVTEVMADERDYETSGKAARWAITIYSFLAFLGAMIFFTFKESNQSYEAVGSVLAYSACLIMFSYSLIFSYLRRNEKEGRQKFIYIAFIVIIALMAAIASLRFLSGEDDWMCQDGQWIQHGHPDFPMPTAECK